MRHSEIHKFTKRELFDQAVTHSSIDKTNYERLEFIGDSIVRKAVAMWLYRNHKWDEGKMTLAMVNLSSTQSLARACEDIDLDSESRYKIAHGQSADSILADIFEAWVAAVELDGNCGEKAVIEALKPQLANISLDKMQEHPKNRLQQFAHRYGHKIEYNVMNHTGPDHALTYHVEVTISGKSYGIGRGSNKRAAETEAAEIALRTLEIK